MELAWNTQKNKMTDVKGKEMEQERKGRIKNDDIDLSRTHLNYDIVQSDKTLYQRVKERVEDLKKSGSRVQKNSVVMYSNILTVPREQAEKWGEKKTDEYFKACYDFFCREFGTENVVSAVVHKDETSPHMHLHFVPVNKENGRLQARIAMNRQRINQIHNELPKFLQERGFDVKRASGKTKDKNIENIHEYKQVQKNIQEKEQKLKELEIKIDSELEKLDIIKQSEDENEIKPIVMKKGYKSMPNVELKKNLIGKYTIEPNQLEKLKEFTSHLEEENRELQKELREQEERYEKLREVHLQDRKMINQLVDFKMRSERENWAEERFKYDKQVSYLTKTIEALENENKALKDENTKLVKWRNTAIQFMKKSRIFEQFQKWLNKPKTLDNSLKELNL